MIDSGLVHGQMGTGCSWAMSGSSPASISVGQLSVAQLDSLPVEDFPGLSNVSGSLTFALGRRRGLCCLRSQEKRDPTVASTVDASGSGRAVRRAEIESVSY